MPRATQVRRAVGLASAALAITAAASACSSSSSGGGDATPTSSLTPTASATSGASTAPPAFPAESFHGVGSTAATKLENTLPLERGVSGDTYYPDSRTFVVSYTSTATSADKKRVERLVQQAKEGKALPTPTPTPPPGSQTVNGTPFSVLNHPPVTRHPHRPPPPPHHKPHPHHSPTPTPSPTHHHQMPQPSTSRTP